MKKESFIKLKTEKQQIRVAIAGVGNCASALVQGLTYYQTKTTGIQEGLIIPLIGPYAVSDISVVAAFDIDTRKVGKQLEKAIFSIPNCTSIFASDIPPTGVTVKMGPTLDGVPPHMKNYPGERTFCLAEAPTVDIAEELAKSKAEILLCYLPVGAEKAVHHYASACLSVGVAFINCMPSFIASNPLWADRFRLAGLPIIGDDVKSQVGATIVHRTLTNLMTKRGYIITRTYQLNAGGNTDFLNMLDRGRVASKIKSKVDAVQSQLHQKLPESEIHAGPSDYVPWLGDNKVAFIRIEGYGFGGAPIEIDLRLSVQDSPNSAAVVVDVIRIAKLALDKGLSGPLEDACAYYMKSPPRQYTDDEARQRVEAFIRSMVGTD